MKSSLSRLHTFTVNCVHPSDCFCLVALHIMCIQRENVREKKFNMLLRLYFLNFRKIRSAQPPERTIIYKIKKEEFSAFQNFQKVKELFSQASYPKHHPNTVKVGAFISLCLCVCLYLYRPFQKEPDPLFAL